MTPLEQALRDAFASDLDSPVDRLVGDVRRNAERRRARRATVVAGAAVAAVVAAVAIGMAALDGQVDTPDPAPSPTESATDTAPAPWRQTWAVESAGDQVFVTGRAADCGCAVLWTGQPGEWTRLHDFSARYVERLAFTPDGQHGIASDERSTVWTTHDGGHTWAAAPQPLDGGRRIGGSFVVAADADHLWAADVGRDTLWRSSAASDAFEQVRAPGVVWDVEVAAGAVVLTLAPQGDGSTTVRPVVSTDGGRTWDDLPSPCRREGELRAVDGALFFSCSEENGVVVHRSTSFTDWHVLGRVTDRVVGVVPIGYDRVLVRGRSSALMTEKGSYPSTIDLRSASIPWDAAPAPGAVYITSDHGLFVSLDLGRTWERVG